ncbi:hypothetical protein GF351_02800, partial [Candidatus Woesearchaeota archaeon]|nr:hypothetical protein [Candidatus Woesearchaeota archaeon]
MMDKRAIDRRLMPSLFLLIALLSVSFVYSINASLNATNASRVNFSFDQTVVPYNITYNISFSNDSMKELLASMNESENQSGKGQDPGSGRGNSTHARVVMRITDSSNVSVRSRIIIRALEQHKLEQHKIVLDLDRTRYGICSDNMLEKGDYSVEIIPEDMSIRKIEFPRLEITEDLDDLIRLDEVNTRKLGQKDFVAAYAIDPSGLEFREAVVTVNATGTSMFKCRDWNFDSQVCEGSWKLFRTDLVPGEEYSFILTPDDPGFGEIINISAADHLDQEGLLVSSIYDEVKEYDNRWSEPIMHNEYVRARFEENLTAENDITLYVRNNQTYLTLIEVYPEDSTDKLAEFPIIQEQDYYTIPLEDMKGENSTFDLKILNLQNFSDAYLEFDHIVDPASEKDMKHSGICDASGNLLDVKLTVLGKQGDVMYSRTKKAHIQELPRGMYEVKLQPEDPRIRKIKQIHFHDLELSGYTGRLVDIDEPADKSGFDELYAINPLASNFTNATVTVTATGHKLYKCREWNFTTQQCLGSWKLLRSDLLPGQEYNITITPDDPGFGEIILAKEVLHLDANRSVLSDITNQTRHLDGSWSGTVEQDEYVRVTFTKNLSSENDITVFPEAVEGAPRIEIYEQGSDQMIAEFAVLNNRTYNKVYLTGLEGKQDTFDLRMLDGSAEFDHIIDPPAYYDSGFTAPYCAGGESPCIANSSLLKCRNGVSDGYGPEPNEPNTIDSCADGTGTYSTPSCGGDESVENITVYDHNNSVFRPGDLIGVEAVVHCYDTADHLALVYTNNSNEATPNWIQMQYIANCPSAGYNSISFDNFTLHNTSGNHSVRVWINYDTSQDTTQTCAARSSGTNYADNDDVVFLVEREPVNTPPTTPTSITCDGGSCNSTFTGDVVLNCSGSTDADGDEITYVIEASLDDETSVTNLTDISMTADSGLETHYFGACSGAPESCSSYPSSYDTDEVAYSGYVLASAFDLSESGTPTRVAYYISVAGSSGDEEKYAIYDDDGTGGNPGTLLCSGTGTVDVSSTGWKEQDISGCGELSAGKYWIAYKAEAGNANHRTDNTVTAGYRLQYVGGSLNFVDSFPSSFGSSTEVDESEAVRVTYTTSGGATNETKTTYTTYNDINNDYSLVNNIGVKIEVDSYNPEASVELSTADPDLELEIYNGSEWLGIGNFSLPAIYTGTGLDTTNHNFTLTTTEATILKAWETSSNQDIRIRGVGMDWYNSTMVDEINYTGVQVTVTGKAWSSIGNHTNGSTHTWNTSKADDQSDVDIRCRARDIDGSNTYSDYFTGGYNLTIESAVSDTVAPAITLNYPTVKDNASSPVNFNWTAVDDMDTNITCNLTIDGSVNQSAIYSLNDSFTNYTVSGFSDGIHQWNVSCVDDSGNSNTSETRSFTVDTIRPNITIITPLGNDILGWTVLLRANVTDSLLSVHEARYEIWNGTDSSQVLDSGIMNNYEGDLYNGTLYTNDTWPYNASDPLINSTNLTFIVYANDSVGNSLNTSTYWTLDNTNPSVQYVNPPLTGKFVNSDFTLEIFFSNHRLNYTSYNITLSGTPVKFNSSYSNASTYSFTDLVDVNPLSDGNYTITSYANDFAGNNRTKLSWFYVDKTIPNATVQDGGWVSPTPANNTYTNTQAHTFNLTCNETFVDTVWINFNGTLNKTPAGSLGIYYWWSYGGLAEGTYVYTGYCNDSAGNNATTATRTLNIDLTAPGIALNHPIDNYNTSETSVSFNWTAQDNFDTSMLCNLTINGQVNQTDIVSANGTATNFTVNNMAGGTYYWNLSCKDDSNNTNTSLTYRFVIDLTPPNVTQLVPQAGLNFSVTDTIQVAANITDYMNISAAYANITLPNSTIVQLLLSYAGGDVFNASYSIPELKGPYSVVYFANDSFGNINNTETTSFNVNTYPNITSLDHPQDEATLNITQTDFNFTAYEDLFQTLENCTLYTNFTGTWQKTATVLDVPNSTRTNITVSVPDGAWIWNIKCTDSLGLSGWFAQNYTFTMQTGFRGLVAYNELDVQAPRYRIWNEFGHFGNELTDAQDVGGDIVWT